MCGFVSLLMLDGRPVAAPLLAAMRDTLSHLVAECAGDQRPDCPILRDLGGAPTQN